MSEKIVSPFRMIDWQIGDFHFSNPLVVPVDPEAEAEWRVLFQKDNHYIADKKIYLGIVSVRFSVTIAAKSDDVKPFEMNGTAASLSSFPSETDDEQSRERLDRFLSINATSYTIGALRSFLIQQSCLLMKYTLIMPSINLNKVEFNKEYTLQ